MVLESNQDLSFAYHQTLCCISTEELLHALSNRGLAHIFQLLGGREDALCVDGPVRLGRSSRKGSGSGDIKIEYTKLIWVPQMTLLLTTGISSWWSSILARWLMGENSISLSKTNSQNLLIGSRISSDQEVFKEACKLLGRLALDVRVAKCSSLRAAIEDSLEYLFHAVPESEWEGMASPTIRTLMLSILIFRRLYQLATPSSPQLATRMSATVC